MSPDQTHPYRQTELVREVNRRLPRRKRITSYDIQAVRAAHELDADTAPEFCHKPRYASQQYSDAMVDWIVEQHAQDPDFFDDARVVLVLAREHPETVASQTSAQSRSRRTHVRREARVLRRFPALRTMDVCVR